MRNSNLFYPLAFILFLYLFNGCAPNTPYTKFYNQISPTKYAKTDDVKVFYYSGISKDDIYSILYSDFLIIGKSSFCGGMHKLGRKSLGFAKSIGTDVLVIVTNYKETVNSQVPLTMPSSSTTTFTGYSGGEYVSGTLTTNGSKTTYIPISVDRYNQDGLFLKNINSIKPLWEKTRTDYDQIGTSELDGDWYSEDYKLHIFSSDDKIVGFLTEKPNLERRLKKLWNIDDLKLVYNKNDGHGFYMMADKRPECAKFNVNKFGHLEIFLPYLSFTTSFARSNGNN